MYVEKHRRKSGSVAYRAVIYANGRRVKTKLFDKKAEARAWAKRIEQDMGARVTAYGSKIGPAKFTELCDLYLDWWKGDLWHAYFSAKADMAGQSVA